MSTTIITSWLLTYLVHSTILLGAAWLGSRFLGDRRLALQETLLRTALIGGLLTTTLQVGAGVEPIGGALAIDGLVRPDAVTAVSARDDGDTISVASPNIIISTPPTLSDRAGGLWPIALLSLWGCGSMLALLVLGRSTLDLRRLLKTRRFRPAGRLVERLAAAMGLRRPVRLSTSAAIAVPFATGIRQPEICCPERVCDLALEHQTGLFAHELAHLARRDPAWQLLYRLGEAILFLQPLNCLVRRRLEEIAEHLTDERAVACTGDRLGLARCLVVVAHWGMSSSLGVPVTAFATGPRLDRRIRRLLEGGVAGKMTPARVTPLMVCLLGAAAFTLPVVSSIPAHAEFTRAGSYASSTKTWSDAKEAPSEVPRAPDPLASAQPPALAPNSVAEPNPVAKPVLEAAPAPVVASAPHAAPASEAAPAPIVALSPAVPLASEAAPASLVAPSPAAVPTHRDSTAQPVSPTAPKPPPTADEPTPEDPAQNQRERTREEARNRQRESQRERSEAEALARERARSLAEERRALAERARELSREAAESARLTDAEREKLRSEAREHARAVAERSREMAEQSRQLAREAAQRARLADTEREEIQRHAEELRTEARERAREAGREAAERARELSEKARRLAEEAEAERRAEEERGRREAIE